MATLLCPLPSHGRITKSHNNVLSRPTMYLYTHFKEEQRIHFFDVLLEKQTAYSGFERNPRCLLLKSSIERASLPSVHDSVKMMQCR